MRRFLSCLLIVLGLSMPAQGQDLVADLSQNRVSVTASFSGSQIVVFGAIKPDPGVLLPEPLDVIVAVSGPSLPVTIRKKNKVAAIWVNTQAVEIDQAPTLYKVATTRPIRDILSFTSDLRHKITIDQAIRSVGAPPDIKHAENFTEALLRIQTDKGLYEISEGSVSLAQDTLFRTTVDLPANLIEGEYTARIFLTHEKKVIAKFSKVLDVRKVGLERWIYNLAHERPLIYGLLSLAIAISAGWLASTFFRYIRG